MVSFKTVISSIDRVLDCIPLVSTIKNGIVLLYQAAQKTNNQNPVKKIEGSDKIKDIKIVVLSKNKFTAGFSMIPVIGNVYAMVRHLTEHMVNKKMINENRNLTPVRNIVTTEEINALPIDDLNSLFEDDNIGRLTPTTITHIFEQSPETKNDTNAGKILDHLLRPNYTPITVENLQDWFPDYISNRPNEILGKVRIETMEAATQRIREGLRPGNAQQPTLKPINTTNAVKLIAILGPNLSNLDLDRHQIIKILTLLTQKKDSLTSDTSQVILDLVTKLANDTSPAREDDFILLLLTARQKDRILFDLLIEQIPQARDELIKIERIERASESLQGE